LHAEVVEPKQQPRDRRLAGAGRSDDRYRVAGRDLEIQPFEDWPFRIVGKGDVLETDRAVRHIERPRIRRIFDLRLARQD
jgi:hypothetical protein